MFLGLFHLFIIFLINIQVFPINRILYDLLFYFLVMAFFCYWSEKTTHFQKHIFMPVKVVCVTALFLVS